LADQQQVAELSFNVNDADPSTGED